MSDTECDAVPWWIEHQQMMFDTAVLVCADNVYELRRSDVFRAIETSFNQGPVGMGPDAHTAHTLAFIAWLRGKRPDLNDAITLAKHELATDQQIDLTETPA